MQNGETHEISGEPTPIDCFRCGICCVRFRPKLGDDEITAIANRLGMTREAFVESYTRVLPKSGERILDNGGNQCPFLRWLNDNARAECTIYLFRPRACHNWQASLSRRECREGLSKLKPQKHIILPQDIYFSQQEIDELNCILLKERHEQEEE